MTNSDNPLMDDVLHDPVTQAQGNETVAKSNGRTPKDSCARYTEPNVQNLYRVTRADLPLHCPMEGMSLWNSHPRVYLPIEATGQAKCPYCGADYILT